MKKTISLANLYTYNYSISVPIISKRSWKIKNDFSCLGKPKEVSKFLFLHNYKAKYTTKDGEVIYANHGDIIYTPENSEYTVEFFDNGNEDAYSIALTISFTDENNEPFIIDDKICVFKAFNIEYHKVLFSRLDKYYSSTISSPAKLKSVAYEVLSDLSYYCKNKLQFPRKFQIISKGIRYIEEDEKQELSIKEIATMCNVSEIYFRKLFKSYAGISPNEYRLRTKISKAKQYLEHENMSIATIAEICGFNDPAYFSRQFKKITGVSPIKFKEDFD